MLLLRSLYDLLPEVATAVAAKLVYLDGNNRPFVKNLPDSFRGVALNGDDLRTAEDIESRWKDAAAVGGMVRRRSPVLSVVAHDS